MKYTITAIYDSGREETHHAKSEKDRDLILKALSRVTTIKYVNAKEKK